ncbi:hypothetical protein [Corynebacterium aquilae]|uniref:hypothetical protein n=1 Tax=Corynebacterium aquilae TaxID=203263 RepID=UPI0012EE5049|nr:hypothetical protein [Corynebacterium aquilae]
MNFLTHTVRRVAALTCAVGCAAAFALTGPDAAAIPPGGPRSNTPGTDSDISPTTLEPCDTISFSVTGYPAGEVVYIKIDDGIGYGDVTKQGSGVIHRQTADASGTADGSLDLPCGIQPGEHWLRFLSSEAKLDANGNQIGSEGFTNRSENFTVVAPSGTNAERVAAESQETSQGSGTQAMAESDVQAAVQQATRNTRNGRVTTTRTVAAAPAAAAAGAAAAEPEPAAAQQQAPAAAAAAPAKAKAADAKAKAADAKNPVKGAGALQATGGKTQQKAAQQPGQRIAYDPATDSEYVVAQSQDRAPMIGLLVGGAILIVGFGAIAAYLYVNRRPRGGDF